MRLTAFAMMAAVTLSGCGQSVESRMAEITVAELKGQLRDPGSLQLSGTKIQVHDGWGAICGYYNAANGYGGMAGRERFVRVFNPEEVEILQSTGYSSEKNRQLSWEINQTKLLYEQEDAAGRPLPNRPERMRGLFTAPEEPILTLRYTTNRCITEAEPITLKP